METLVNSHGLSWIALKIFKDIPWKDLIHCRQVNRGWKELIDSEATLWRPVIQDIFDSLDYASNAVEVFPDLQNILLSAMSKNAQTTKELVPQFYCYFKEIQKLPKSKNRKKRPKLDLFAHPVHFAALTNNLNFLKLLKDCNADLNVFDRFKHVSALFQACLYGHEKVIK